MATGNPLDDDVSGVMQHGPQDTDANPLTSDLVAGSIPTTSVLRAPGILDRGWASLIQMPSIYNQANPPPSPPGNTPVRDVAKDVVGSGVRGGVGALDTLLNPSELVMKPLVTGGLAAYDWLAPKFGLPQSTAEQRGDLLNQPGPAGVAAAAVPGPDNPMVTPPKTMVGQQLDAPVQGAIGGLAFGPLTPMGPVKGAVFGAAGAEAGSKAAELAPERYRDLVGLVTNSLVQGAGNAVLPNPGSRVSGYAAQTAQTGRQQGIPFNATDITPGSVFRDPGHVQDTVTALQGNLVRDLGQNPNTGSTVTANKVTPDVMTAARADTSQTYNDIGQRTNITMPNTPALLTRIQQIQNNIDTDVDMTPQQKQQARQNVGLVAQAINRTNGQMPGSDYLDLTRTDSTLDRMTKSSMPGAASAATAAIDALHDAFHASASPQDQTALTQANYRWRLMNTLQPLVDLPDANGNINMSALADRIREQSQNLDLGGRNMAYTGGRQLGDYGRQARLIAQGSQPQSVNPISKLASSPTTMLGIALAQNPATSAALQATPGLLQSVAAPYLRSGFHANQVIQGALNPQNAYQRALTGGLLGTVPN